MLAATAASAQAQDVSRGPVPAWVTASSPLPVPQTATGAVFVRRQDVEAHLGSAGQAQYYAFRVKILQSSALGLGNISIEWDPSAGAPIVHGIKLFRDGNVVDVLKDASFEILRREGQLEEAKLNGTLTAVVRVPDLRVGDELEVELTTFGNDPTLGRHRSGLLQLSASPAPGRYHLGLSWDEGYEPNLQMTPDMTAAMQKTERAVHFRFDDPPVVSPPKDAPPRYQWQRVVEYSNFSDWAALSRQFAPLYANASTTAPGSLVDREAARIAAAHANPLDRANAALKLVQQDVRYIYVGLNGGNLRPASADETWQRRYGDCKGKTALLLALLGKLGISAEAVLVNSSGADDGFDQRLPIPQLFDHVLVRARIDGAAYWLDGTLPPVASASMRPVFPVSWVLPLTEKGSTLEKLEWRPAAAPDEIHLFEIDSRAGFDKPARIVSTTILRGVAGLQQQIQFASVSAGQLLEVYRQTAIGNTWQAIDDVRWHYDQDAGASILSISGIGTVDWDDDGDGERSFSLPGGGFSPPQRRVRAASSESVPFYTEPEYSCHVTTVRLPTSTRPGQWSSAKSYDTRIFGRHYHRAWELRDGAIRMVRGLRVEQPEIDAAAAQRDNDRIASFDNSTGWISYQPSGKKGSVGSGERVPAAYDFDWTAGEVPCISSKSMEKAAPSPP